MDPHPELTEKKSSLAKVAVEMAKTEMPKATIGKSLGVLSQGNVEIMVQALHAGWSDPTDRREVLLGAGEHIKLAEVIIALEMEQVNWNALRSYIHGNPKADPKTASEILLCLRNKLVRDDDWIGLLHMLLDDRPELERTEPATNLFANLITEAVRSHFAADGKEDPQADAEYIELLRDKLTEELTSRIKQLKEKKSKEKKP